MEKIVIEMWSFFVGGFLACVEYVRNYNFETSLVGFLIGWLMLIYVYQVTKEDDEPQKERRKLIKE